ncbi:MAG: hypothetical protein DRJ61_15960, partial [Acidobacteria bacterium]
VLFLAAVVGEDDAPVLATDTATPENTTSGGLIWSEPTTTWDVNDLGPKSWWRAQYYYRARWYAPGIMSFIERDPLGFHDSSNMLQFLGYSPFTLIDPFGTNVVPEPDLPKPLFPWLPEGPEVPELPLLPGTPPIRTPGPPGFYPAPEKGDIQGPLRRDINTTRRMARDLERFTQKYASLTTNMNTGMAVSFAFDMADKYDGSSGFSIEGIGAIGPWGAHLGLNVQVFHKPGGRYSLGLYGFETLTDSNLHNFAPFTTGVTGLGGGVSGSINVAKAFKQEVNNPRGWEGYVETLSGSGPIPGIPIIGAGMSFFGSENFFGVEASVGFGTPFTAAWSTPNFHLLLEKKDVDRSTVEAIYALLLQRASP